MKQMEWLWSWKKKLWERKFRMKICFDQNRNSIFLMIRFRWNDSVYWNLKKKKKLMRLIGEHELICKLKKNFFSVEYGEICVKNKTIFFWKWNNLRRKTNPWIDGKMLMQKKQKKISFNIICVWRVYVLRLVRSWLHIIRWFIWDEMVYGASINAAFCIKWSYL